jgi:hypothetical protein
MLTGCLSREQVDAKVWLNNAPLPAELCAKLPELKEYGFYRKLNDGTIEFMSFCDPRAADWLSMYKTDYGKIMDQLLPKPKGQK